ASGRDSAPKVLEGKGATFYGIGLGLARLTEAIRRDENVILPVSAYLEGEYGCKDLYIGVPSILSNKGVKDTIELTLTDEVHSLFYKSLQIIKNNINQLDL